MKRIKRIYCAHGTVICDCEALQVRKVLIYGACISLLALIAIPTALLASGYINRGSLAMVMNVMLGSGIDSPDEQQVHGRLHLPAGFGISVYADNLSNARLLRFSSRGDLLVSRPHAGDIVLLLRDPADPTRAAGRQTVIGGLRRPQGIDLVDGWLYVAESDAVGRIRFDANTGTTSGAYTRIITGLTDNGNHVSKTLRIGPDRKLYLAQGSTCNVCIEEDRRRATIARYELDGSGAEIYASGLRNSVGMDWAPWDGALYATDNGRDLLGDNFPPCELNRIVQGGFYGWPFFNGDNLPDPDLGAEAPPGITPIPPAHGFRAHNAPLGITFIDAGGLPDTFRKSALVALHGSWNRSVPDGYRVVSLHWRDGNIEERDFLWGFEIDGDVIGRPVDVAQGPDGAFYISDDYAGTIYRVSYGSAGGALATWPATARPQRPATATDAGLVARGAELFARSNCAECHHADAATAVMAMRDLASRLDRDGIVDKLRYPQAPMPVYAFGDDDRLALAEFLLARADASATH